MTRCRGGPQGPPAGIGRGTILSSMGSITVEMIIRLAAFGVFFSAFALWELLAPRRGLSVGPLAALAGQSRDSRWPTS